MGIRIDRIWSMPSKWTFSIKPIAKLLKEEMENSEVFIEPFSGQSLLSTTIKNDINFQEPHP
jgi:hypothetical protein